MRHVVGFQEEYLASSWHIEHRVPDPKTFGRLSDSIPDTIVGQSDPFLSGPEERPGLPVVCHAVSRC